MGEIGVGELRVDEVGLPLWWGVVLLVVVVVVVVEVEVMLVSW